MAVHDTLQEVTTITVQTNDRGDTLKVTQITDRSRLRERSDVRSKKEEVKLRVDTVYIERHDSSYAEKTIVAGSEYKSTWGSRFRSTLKWIFAILCASILLIIVIKFGLRRSFF